MKRLFAIMMALAMMLSLGVTAFAADNGSITITNATVGETYAPFKIFDATYDTAKGAVSYTIETEDQFFDELFVTNTDEETGKTTYSNTATNTFFTYTPIDNDHGFVTIKDGYNKAKLFEYLKGLVEKEGMVPAAEAVEATGDEVKFENLPYGYYVITSTLGAAVTIDSATPDVKVEDKNSKNNGFEKKIWNGTEWTDHNTAQVGDVVNFKLEFIGVNYKTTGEGEDKVTEKVQNYTITDTMTPAGWADIKKDSIEVIVGEGENEKTLKAPDDYTIEYTKNADGVENGFVIIIKWQDGEGNFLYDSSSPVKVTYSATVKDVAANATAAANKNTAELTWKENSDKETGETTTKTFNMGFTKVDGSNSNAPLAGAEFKLYKDADCTQEIWIKRVDLENGIYAVTTVESEKTTIVTPTTGKVVIMGLKDGVDYYLKETKAPDGYNPMAGATTVKLGETETDTITIGEANYKINNNEKTEIVNNKGVELPSTGGEGTMKMITIGTIIAIGFAVLLITNKKMTVYQD